MDRIPRANWLGTGFAGQHGIVDRAAPCCNDAVGSERFAGGDEHQHSRLKVIGRDTCRGAVISEHAGTAAHSAQQRADPRTCPVSHPCIERAAGKQEKQQHDRAVEIGVLAARRGFIEAQTRCEQNTDGDRDVHIGSSVTQRPQRGGKEHPSGIRNDRQGDDRREPVKHLACCAVGS